MRENKERMERKRKKAEEKLKKRAEAEPGAGPGMETGAAIAEEVEIQKDLEKGDSERSSSIQ